MLTTRFRTSIALALAIVTATGSGLLAQREARGTPQPEVRGVLKAVDAGKGTLTVDVGDGRQEPVEKTFTVAKTAEVGLNVGIGRRGSFREGKLADLAPGAFVVLQLSADQKTVESVQADGPSV